MKYIIFNEKGNMLRSVQCPPALAKAQRRKGGFIMKGEADDATQKIEFDGFDVDGQPINPRVVDKTLEELTIETPTGPQLEAITNEQWQKVLNRLSSLERGQ